MIISYMKFLMTRSIVLHLFPFLFVTSVMLNAQLSSDIHWIKGGLNPMITSFSQSHDGQYIAAIDSGGRVGVWEEGFKKQVALFRVPVQDLPNLVFLKNQAILAISSGAMVSFVDIHTSRTIATTQLNDGDIHALIDVNDNNLLVAHRSGVMNIIELDSYSLHNTWRLPQTQLNSFRTIANDSILLFVNSLHQLHVWDLHTHQILPFSVDLGSQGRFAGSANTSSLALADGLEVYLFDVRTGDTLFSKETPYHSLEWISIGLSGTGDSIVYVHSREKAKLITVSTGIEKDLSLGLYELKGPGYTPRGFKSEHDALRIQFSNDGKGILFRVFDFYTFATFGYQLLLYNFEHDNKVEYIGENGERSYVWFDDRTAVLDYCCRVDIKSGSLLSNIYRDPLTLFFRYSRDARTVVWGSEPLETILSGEVTVATVGGKVWTAWNHYEHLPWCYDVSNDGQYVILGGELYFADSTYSQRKGLSPGFAGARFAWDSYHFAGWGSERIYIWDCRTISVVNEIPVNSPPRVVEFSKNSQRIAVGYNDGRIEVYNPFDGELLVTLEGHHGRVNDLSFTRHDRFLVSAGEDSTVRTWKLQTGVNDYTYDSYPASHVSVSTTSDGKYVLSSTDDGVTLCWFGRGEIGSVEAKELLHKALEARLTPNPSNKDNLLLSCNLDRSGLLEVRIVDVKGEQVYEFNQRVEPGQLLVPIQTDRFGSGTYFCRVVLRSGAGSRPRNAILPLVMTK